jgi:peptidoglycan hydrolase-like protein with peptidoglycan-binding domain
MSFSSTLTYTDADFRAQFPFFADPTVYSEAQLEGYFNQGSVWISTFNFGALNNQGRQSALYMMTAHLQTLADQTVANNNAPGGVEIEARIDKIQVAIMPPKVNNFWQQWLTQTPYGQQLLALLLQQAVGGFWIGGNPELAAFRRVGGGFSRGFW